MRTEKITFDEALGKYRNIIKHLAEAKTQEEVSKMERDGRRAMHEVQYYAGFLGYELKDAVKAARLSVRTALDAARTEPVEKPVEKPKKVAKKTTKKATKKKTTKKEK